VGEFFAESVYSDGQMTIRLLAYRAHLEAGAPASVDHDEIAWVTAGELGDYTFSPADRPFVNRLQKGLWEMTDR
jgi:8-oxo-dGTP diphosphatase